MAEQVLPEFMSIIQKLEGLSCWSVQAGAVGSMASLHFGEKIPLKKPLHFPNTSLSADEHKFRGEFVLYIEDCPWRIENQDTVLTSWLDNNITMLIHLNNLVAQQISNVELSTPGLDLAIRFSSNIHLKIFPDQIDPDQADNYSLANNESIYIVAARSTLYKDRI